MLITINRKKKCNSTQFPCSACTRLRLLCEEGTRLVWGDDARRSGIKREPRPGGSQNNGDNQLGHASQLRTVIAIIRSISHWPIDLDPVENALLDCYIQREVLTRVFDVPRTYKSILTMLLPLANSNGTALLSLLALSGARRAGRTKASRESTLCCV